MDRDFWLSLDKHISDEEFDRKAEPDIKAWIPINPAFIFGRPAARTMPASRPSMPAEGKICNLKTTKVCNLKTMESLELWTMVVI